MGFENVSLSHALLPVIKLVHRAHSTTADAYLTPETKKYINGFLKGFKMDSGRQPRIEFMQSDGGLVSYDKFSGLRAILSGPAGGVVGYARTCYEDTNPKPVIGFDMVRTATAMHPHCVNSGLTCNRRVEHQQTYLGTAALMTTSPTPSQPACTSTARN